MYKGAQRMTIQEAAEALNISESGVRMRIRRGQLESEKEEDGRVYVWVDIVREMSSVDSDFSTFQPVLEVKDEVIETLKQQVETQRQELERKDQIISQLNANMASLMQRIPELEPASKTSSDARESPVTASEEEAKGEIPPEPEKAELRPWWRRLFSR